jgi:hypothetical protein
MCAKALVCLHVNFKSSQKTNIVKHVRLKILQHIHDARLCFLFRDEKSHKWTWITLPGISFYSFHEDDPLS